MTMNRSFRATLFRNRRAAVAIYVAMLAPVLAGVVALGVEVSSWASAQVNVQRIADASASQGAITCYNYLTQSKGSQTCLNTNSLAQTAATLSAQLAEVNGASGGSNAAWNSTTNTYSDNNITAQVIDGVQSASDAAVEVSVQQSVPLTLAGIFNSKPSITVSASSTAEVVSSTKTTTTGGSGGQPCLLALSTSAKGTGLTTTGSINASGCTLVSDSNLTASGGGSFTASGIYAVGQTPSSSSPTPSPILSIPCWMDINGTTSKSVCYNYATIQSNPAIYPGASSVPDPYSSAAVSDPNNVKAAIKLAIANAASTTGPSISCPTASTSGLYNGSNGCNLPGSSGSTYNGSYCTGQGTSAITCYLQPGNYGSFTISGGGSWTFKFAPGGYVFNGNMNFSSGNMTFSGTGVTIYTTGTFSGGSSFSMTLTAPSSTVEPSPTTAGPWQIAGVALAGGGTNSTTFSLSGSSTFNIDGVVYFPNAAFTGSGSDTIGSSSGSCLEMIFSTISLSGATNIASSGCSGLNALAYTSVPATTSTTTQYSMKLVK